MKALNAAGPARESRHFGCEGPKTSPNQKGGYGLKRKIVTKGHGPECVLS